MHTNDRAPIRSRKSEPDQRTLDSGLYLVATPIGNLDDITLRALKTLEMADLIACEDTRVSRKLLQAYQLSTHLVAYHDHNAAEMRPKLIEKMQAGKVIALISDAGTPLISDPGYKLVQACVASNIPVTCVPGPSALLAGLSLSALPTDRFFFAGFLSAKEAAKKAELKDLSFVPGTLVFFESPSRLSNTLTVMSEILGNRPAAIARELTKKFEEVQRGTLNALKAYYKEAAIPKGELVVIIGPPLDVAMDITTDRLDEMLERALKNVSLKEAVAQISAQTGFARRIVYARALALSRDKQ